jgi:hypothetical protein
MRRRWEATLSLTMREAADVVVAIESPWIELLTDRNSYAR